MKQTFALLLEEYDFSGKTIIPFCSHGGRFGQSLTAITKLASDAVATWLVKNEIL